MERVDRFWQRVTEGMQLSQLWSQFQADARSSYRLYSKDVDVTRGAGVRKGEHFLNVAYQFFWAILEKLSPARRVLLLLALVLVVIPGGEWSWRTSSGEAKAFVLDFHLYGGLLMFALLILEVGDRVVMKRDLQIAKEIQTWLLPAESPSVPGLSVAFTTRAANTVAGDYYDVFARPCAGPGGGSYLIAVADVAGKSIPAALLMATFQASLKTLCAIPGTLTELVARMNQYACSNSQNGRRFTTTFLAEYEPDARSLTYVNAGHNTPILRSKDGTVRRLEEGGLPLGILPEALYQSAALQLESGDWLIIFTDGVVEAEDSNAAEYGETRLLAMINAYAGTTPAVMLARIMEDIDRFVGNAPQHDDITCVVLKAV